MGSANSIAWVADADSISRPGEKAILTDPIEGLTMEDYFSIMETYLRERPCAPGMFEVNREVKDLPDGGLHEAVDIEVSGVAAVIAGNVKMRMHNVYRFKPSENEWTIEAYLGDETLKLVTMRNVVKVHADPFRLEAMCDEFETRKSGPVLKGLVKTKLEKLGYDVDVEADVPSPSSPGERSIVSGEISDLDLTIKSFWEKISAQMEEDGTGTILPDGSIVQESSIAGLVGTSYFRWSLEEGDGCIKSMDFGKDEKMEDVKAISFWKLHEGPKRIEVWATSVAGRRCGPPSKKLMEEMHAAAMKMRAEKGG